MTRLFLKGLAAHFRGGKTLFLLTLFGVALGVASVLSIQIINRNALGAFSGSLRAVSGEADLTVLPRGPALDEGIYPAVLGTAGVAAAWPLLRVDVSLAEEEELYLEVIGFDLFAPVRLPWKGQPGDLAQVWETPGWAAVTPELAAARGWDIGTRFTVTSGSARVRLEVGALVDFRRVSPLASSRMIVMDIAQAQTLFGTPGRLDQIDVQIAAGAARAEVIDRLRARLGDAVSVATPEQREQQAASLLGAFRLNLTALSLISLFVGAFLVYSSTQASLVRRRGEFGLLRSLGTTRGQLLGLILAEVALLGIGGVAAGLPMGYWVASANVDTVSATLSNLYLLEEIETLQLPLWLWLMAGIIGIGGAAAGALMPALDMSRRETHALLVAFNVHERVGAAAGRLFAAGAVLLGLAAAMYAVAGRAWRPAGFGLGIAVLVALPLLTPYLIRAVTSRLHPTRFSLLYGFKSLGQRLQNTSFAVAALAVAVSMLFGITMMIGSFRRTLEIWVGSTVRADIYVSTDSWRRARGDAVLDDDLAEALAGLDDVRAADRLRSFDVDIDGRRVPVAAIDMHLPGGDSRFSLLEGDPAVALPRVRDSGAVMIGEPLARRESLGPGDELVLYGPEGALAFPIAGVYYDYGSETGSVFMDLSTMRRSFGPGPINNIALYLEPGTDAEATADAIKARFADRPLRVRSNRRLREEITAIFDQTFAITRLLQAMSLLIAVSGITLTLLVLARERISELALYRALGATRRQIFGFFLGQGSAMSIAGLALGAAGGTALAMVMIYVINRVYFGWTIALSIPWADLAGGAAVILGASLAASLYPAMKASRTPATELSREDL